MTGFVESVLGKVGRGLRKLGFAAFVTGLVLLGMVMQAGSYLLAMPSPDADVATTTTAVVAPFAGRGPFAVGVRRLTMDPAPLPLTVWYPALEDEAEEPSITYAYAFNMLAADSALALATYQGHGDPGASANPVEGPYPLVVLSPGFAIRSSSYGWLAEHLASYGFVVASPQHHETLDPGVLWRSAIERPQDVLRLLAYVDQEAQSDSWLAGLIDTDTVAVVGHSYGGYTALAAAGAQWDTTALHAACDTARQTKDPLVFLCDALQPRLEEMADLAGVDQPSGDLWPAWADPRVDAAVSMAGDAAMFGQTGLAQITVPVMAIGGTADTDSPFQWTTQPTFEYAGSPRKIEIALEGAQHFIFAGRCEQPRRVLDLITTGFCSDLGWDRYVAHDLIRHYVTAFLLAELNQDTRAAAELVGTESASPQLSYRQQGYLGEGNGT
jgi:predicted dienelactone hydrolase